MYIVCMHVLVVKMSLNVSTATVLIQDINVTAILIVVTDLMSSSVVCIYTGSLLIYKHTL